MLARRCAAAIGLLVAVVASQAPEFAQQYRQRLGGAIDELRAIVAQFDAEAAHLSLDRQAGLARLRANADELARQRGADLAETVERETHLERQRQDFSTAGPVSQYWVLFTDWDFRLASQTYVDFQPAIPVTSAGLMAGLSGLVAGWALAHAAALPLRRRRRKHASAPSRT